MMGVWPFHKPNQAVIASIIGNIVEYYDFVIYAYFSASIGRTFFPANWPLSQLGLSLATFGLTLLARPLGAVVLGNYADRRGRVSTMMVCILLMALGSLLITLTPSYQEIGIAAPGLVILARLLHGFSLGGEFGSATSYLIEHAPRHEARAASWQAIGQITASLCAATVVLILGLALPATTFETYGFRIATGLGAAAGISGLILRMMLPPESAETATRALSAPAPFLQPDTVLRTALIMGSVALGSGITYLGLYMPHYARSQYSLSGLSTSLAPLLTYGGQLLFTPLRWKLADRFDRTHSVAPMLWSCAFLTLLPIPAFELIKTVPEAVLLMPLLFNLSGLFYFAALDGFIGQIFPSERRGRGLTMGYSFGVVLFGGLAPLTNAALISWTGLSHAPALYMILTAVISFISVFSARSLLDRRAS
ncbi:sugar transporter transmembrane protein [Gluconobacter thailandicus NBRC 3257]|uniref:Sugar transporter transmembrane protein n=1 Tax=Gluconobacter thailandicus NBRC 3257 TaxID=1381097 RepID=A0ABQ0IU05_GLUTH|nr:MFS transporter [Gluconobacter thailandicus]KXV54750.1 sugar transporter [Gluconobacter thailandicus]GAC89119.1 sugar transporter transmembrane protein [Gluconobacter thailandicus NBRC 3255]GAD25672.1 sugar transporter transmembrane protein [Gluconobacter thailandicus NBRC 3257]GBR61225.1 sugar transporter transmembrane protein [Gluconobacter thailandicus F149-1 = NBRC 100600]